MPSHERAICSTWQQCEREPEWTNIYAQQTINAQEWTRGLSCLAWNPISSATPSSGLLQRPKVIRGLLEQLHQIREDILMSWENQTVKRHTYYTITKVMSKFLQMLHRKPGLTYNKLGFTLSCLETTVSETNCTRNSAKGSTDQESRGKN